MLSLRYWTVLALAAGVFGQPPSKSDLDFLSDLTQSSHLSTMTMDALRAAAVERLAERESVVRAVDSRAAFDQRRQMVRERARRALGEFPERTPLNARTVSTLDRGDYRIEKVIFESRPKFYVTANLYVPQGIRGPFPAVLVPLGHEPGGKANPTWQRLLTTLARKGYVALTWDPFGQGERVQFWDEDLQDSKLRYGSVLEHTVIHSQSLLLGGSVAGAFVYDGIRALDYLVSRPEVDSTRIAVTGNSGGGTATVYLAAVEDRFAAVAPSCYITSWKALLSSIGPQDGEQVLPGLIGAGLDFPDFIYAAMPRPYRMLSAIRDFFPIAGARASYAEVQAVTRRAGLEGVVSMTEADDGHGYSRPRRDAFHQWLDALFHPVRAEVPEAEAEPLRMEDLACTTTGQVATSFADARTASDLNLERYRELHRHRAAFSIERVREQIGYGQPGPAPTIARYGVVRKDGYRIERFTVETAPGIVLPAVLLIPSGGRAKKPVVLYADGAGKSALSDSAELMRQDTAVLAVDLRGMGETASRASSDAWLRTLGDYPPTMTALLLGTNMVALRAHDIQRVLDAMSAWPELDGSAISARARGRAVTPMLHAAALDGRIHSLVIDDGLVSYESVITRRIPRAVLEDVVPGALVDYDLPDLMSAMAPRPVWIVSAHDAAGASVSNEALRRVYGGKNVTVGCREAPATAWCAVMEPKAQ